MSLSDDYRKQFQWRSWEVVLDSLPPIEGKTLLDLGCSVGDQAAELAARGAQVIGLDLNEELLRVAKSRGLPHAEFRKADLRNLEAIENPVDGLWCSFVAAYFPDLASTLSSWRQLLRPGGWIAVTEIDDLFGHCPVSPRTKSLFDDYAREALNLKRYDFHMGHRLTDHLERAGFKIQQTLTLEDQEFSFDGPAQEEVVAAWRARLDRMKLLKDFCGSEFEQLRDDFLSCLSRDDHWSATKVICCLAST